MWWLPLGSPPLGPIFGIKGGGTGGGAAKVIPEDEINIHFTGDAHAVGSAHNLLVALTENAAHRKQIPGFTASGISFASRNRHGASFPQTNCYWNRWYK
ncbi:MAG: hypothetical protein CM1200mP8_5150 [Chloroflexota bacterium]|nr:MAG: hypothetical protein CM1200mP8_5150 [Chloroflexota bacterium]